MEIPIKLEDLQLDQICRICLLEKENMQIVSEEISAKLIECASMQFPNGHVLLCKTCETEINKWYSFKQQITKAFEVCKTILERMNPKVCSPTENITEKLKFKSENVSQNNTFYKHSCTQCSQIFQTHGKLRTHLKVHKMQEGYTCNFCNKLFHSAQSLWRHKRRHHENKPYPCSKCLMSFPFKHALDRHFQAKHLSVAKFLCSYCPKKYKVKETLVAHVKKTHSNETSGAVCYYCGKFCKSGNILQVHLRSHTGERPFICDFCKKGFVTKDHMTLHRRIHTGERPYACNECDKKFISSSVLNKHKRSHTGEKPYNCHLCHKSFSLSSAFKAHLKCH